MVKEKLIPLYREMKARYPRLRLYVASEALPNIGEAVDIFMTDLSSHLYDPRTYRRRERPELWHYYCHLPIRWQSRGPLPFAPNMEIDNPALEHRVAMWMSSHWGARGVFIWAGNWWNAAADVWTTGALEAKRSKFPYAGIHNGNGFLVIHGPKLDRVLPTVRLKVLRAGMEDVALLRSARDIASSGRLSPDKVEALKSLLDPVPVVFTHPHYFDRLPETLLQRRQDILELLGNGR
jgi:hypothetical protein